MILLNFLFGRSGHELGIDEVSPRLDVRDPCAEPETLEFLQCLQRRDGVARQHPFEDEVGLRPTGLGVLVDVLHKA